MTEDKLQRLPTTDCHFWEEVAPFAVFGSDVILQVNHTLTEPTLPTATLHFEDPESAGADIIASASAYTLDEAVQACLRKAVEVLPSLIAQKRASGVAAVP